MCGLCSTLMETRIFTISEALELQTYIKLKVPDYINPNSYWWPRGFKGPRIEWLNEQIKILENEKY